MPRSKAITACAERFGVFAPVGVGRVKCRFVLVGASRSEATKHDRLEVTLRSRKKGLFAFAEDFFLTFLSCILHCWKSSVV